MIKDQAKIGLLMNNQYQTITNELGELSQGVMPTLKWWNEITSVVPFQGNSVLDIGCAEGEFCRQAVRAGAISATGIDTDPDRIKRAMDMQLKEKIGRDKLSYIVMPAQVIIERPRDITIMSMISHWLEDPIATIQQHAQNTNKFLVIINRDPHPQYKIPENGQKFVSQDDLVNALPNCQLIHSKLLMRQDKNKAITLMVFKVGIKKHGDHVYKDWPRNGLSAEQYNENIKNFYQLYEAGAPLGLFCGFTPTGYITKYCGGLDLYGRAPFELKKPENDKISDKNREKVRKMLIKLLKTSLKCRKYYADLSPANVMVDDNGAHLIDYDHILSMSAANTIDPKWLPVWRDFLNHCGIGVGFNGDFQLLLDTLEPTLSK